MNEAAIQKAIVHYLRVVLPPTHRVFAVPNGSRRTASGRAANGVPGLTPGVPDLMIVGLGRAYQIEVKAPGGRLSDAQSEWGTWSVCKGCMPWCVAKGINDVKFALAIWGIETRESGQ